MTNKVLRQKSNCGMRLSDKSRFLKQRPNKKVVKIHLNYYKACWLTVISVMMKNKLSVLIVVVWS